MNFIDFNGKENNCWDIVICFFISIIALLYIWLSLYCVNCGEFDDCPPEMKLNITSYFLENNSITFTIENKGLFSFDGFIVKISNKTNTNFGIYLLDNKGNNLSPGEEIIKTYNLKNTKNITFIEVQPYIFSNQKEILCKDLAALKI